jgi:sugar phosphate isomerase/epimerase
MNGVASPWAGRLSLGWLTLSGATALEQIAAAASSGFSGVGLKFARRPGDTEPALAEKPWLFRDIANSLRDNRIALLNMGGIWLDGRPPLEWCTGALEAGAQLGSRFVVAIILDPERRRAIDHFASLCEACRKFGMSVVVEFFAYSAVRTIGEAHQIVAASKQGNAGILVDALHLYRSGGSVESLRRIPSREILLAQICDAPARPPAPGGLSYEGRHDRLDVGAGGLPLLDFAESLPAETPIEVEVPCRRYINMAHRERAALAGNAARTLLQSVGASKVGSSS